MKVANGSKAEETEKSKEKETTGRMKKKTLAVKVKKEKGLGVKQTEKVFRKKKGRKRDLDRTKPSGKIKRTSTARKKHPIQLLPNPVSQEISLTDFYTDHLISIPKEYEIADDGAALQRAEETMQLELGISAADMDSLRKDCWVSALSCPKEPTVSDNLLALRPPDSLGLETLSRLRRAGLKDFRTRCRDLSTYRRLKNIPTDLSYLNARDQGSTEAVGASFLKDILVTAMVMKPLRPGPLGLIRNATTRVHQRIDLLGRELLTDLKDRISCPQDDMILGDCSECLDNVPNDVTAKDLYPSSFFYIEGIFYNDLRRPEQQQDLSLPVMKWILSSPERRAIWGEVSSRRMDEVHFRELTLRIGEPYVYVHQGDCEHILVFSDVRMLGPHDCQDQLRYPLLTGYQMDRSRMCKVCQRSATKWGVVGSDLLPEDPCFLCETCLRLLLYDSDGQKLSPEFRVFMLSRIHPAL